jgi:hypothetical protein
MSYDELGAAPWGAAMPTITPTTMTRPNRTTETSTDAAAVVATLAATAAQACQHAQHALASAMAHDSDSLQDCADNVKDARDAATEAATAAREASALAKEGDPAVQRLAAEATANAQTARQAADDAAEWFDSINLLAKLQGTAGIKWPSMLKTMETNGGVQLPSRYYSAPNGVKLASPAFCAVPKDDRTLNRPYCETIQKNDFLATVRNVLLSAVKTENGDFTLPESSIKLLFLVVQQERKRADKANTRYRQAVKEFSPMLQSWADLTGRNVVFRVDDQGALTMRFVRAFYSDAI